MLSDAQLTAIRIKVRDKLREKREKLANSPVFREPRYDEVYREGLEWLAKLADPTNDEK